MKIKTKYILGIKIWIFINLIGFACTQVTNLPFPDHQVQPVLLGILHPDSLIEVSLSMSRPLQASQGNQFEPINEAVVLIYEDAQLLDTLISLGGGKYQLDYRPIAGRSYKVEAHVSGLPILQAEDTMPQKPDFEITKINEPPRRFLELTLELSDISEDPEVYWLTLEKETLKRLRRDQSVPFDMRRSCGDSLIKEQTELTSFAGIFDDFNEVIGVDGEPSYNGFGRIEDITFNGAEVSFEIITDVVFCTNPFDEEVNAQLLSRQARLVHLLNASQDYDRYLKSTITYSITNYVPEDAEDDLVFIDPFGEPSRIHSNIQNGIGIFAAYNSKTIRLVPSVDF